MRASACVCARVCVRTCMKIYNSDVLDTDVGHLVIAMKQNNTKLTLILLANYISEPRPPPSERVYYDPFTQNHIPQYMLKYITYFLMLYYVFYLSRCKEHIKRQTVHLPL